MNGAEWLRRAYFAPFTRNGELFAPRGRRCASQHLFPRALPYLRRIIGACQSRPDLRGLPRFIHADSRTSLRDLRSAAGVFSSSYHRIAALPTLQPSDLRIRASAQPGHLSEPAGARFADDEISKDGAAREVVRSPHGAARSWRGRSVWERYRRT